MSAFATIQSPDGKYSVEQHDDFGEIGMWSPALGHITIHSTKGQSPDRLYGEAIVFSPDSRWDRRGRLRLWGDGAVEAHGSCRKVRDHANALAVEFDGA